MHTIGKHWFKEFRQAVSMEYCPVLKAYLIIQNIR